MNSQPNKPMVEYLIEKYGDQAYHRATEALASMVIIGGDPDKANELSEATIELLQRGYHKFERKARETNN